MSCSPFELKDYFLRELPAPQRVQVEAHVKTCLPCREELERLELTGAALFALREEEIPQRIAFVSDQIFEPSPVRRWFSAFWGSTARLGFASAAMLSASIFYFATTYSATLSATYSATHPAPAPNRPAVTTVAAVTPSAPEIEQQIQQAVSRAVAEAEARQDENTKQLVADLERRNDETLRSVRWMEGELDANRKRAQVSRVMAMAQPTGDGEIK